MDVLWAVISGVLMIIGLAGCFLPILPGSPIAYLGLLAMQLRKDPPFTWDFMVLWACITGVVALLDYWIPAAGTKKFGGTKYGIYGTMIGLVVGLLFFPPFGIIFGPLVGALIGELIAGSGHKKAIKAAMGSFLGFLLGTLVKVAATCVMIYYYLTAVF